MRAHSVLWSTVKAVKRFLKVGEIIVVHTSIQVIAEWYFKCET